MAKRQRLTVEEVLESMQLDFEELDDPDEPMMEGSDEFSDLEMSDSDNELDNPSSSCTQPHQPNPSSNSLCLQG